MATITETVTVTLTPETMAAAFWEMDSVQQAAVFTALAKVIRKDHSDGNSSAYSLGELQWHYLAKDMDEDARSVLMSIAAPLYLAVIAYTEGLWDVNHGRCV